MNRHHLYRWYLFLFTFLLGYAENRKDVGNMGELWKIPGIGPNIKADLEAIGIHSIADLRERTRRSYIV